MSAEPLPPSEPYVGPRPFQLGEKYFYGRDAEIRELRDLLIARHVALLYSPSGAGKTSLIQAGLIPQLEQRSYRVLHVIRVGAAIPAEIIATGAPINRYLFSALSSLEESYPPDARLPQEQLACLDLAAYLKLRRPAVAPEDEPLGEVLIFDQFEEALTLDVTDLDAKHAFFAALGDLLTDPQALALFSMREDYIASLDPFLAHLPDRLNIRLRIDRLKERQAIQAIQRPAREWDPPVDFSDAAAQELGRDLQQIRVQDLGGKVTTKSGLYIEPVQLQVVCQRIWRNRQQPGAISLDDLRNLREADQEFARQYTPASGGAGLSNVDLALSAYYAEKVSEVAQATGIPERAIRAWFERRMITPQGLRGMVMQGDLENQGLDSAVIIALVNTYLVRSEERRGSTWFELSHDRLIEPVRLNNAWWFQNRLTTLQRLASLWEQADRSPRLLALDDDLRRAEQDAQSGDLTQTEREFLDASRQEAQRLEDERWQRQLQLETAQKLAEEQRQRADEQARSLRAIRRFVIALVVFLIAAILLAMVALQQKRIAQDQRQTATYALADSINQRQTATSALADSNNQRLTATFALGDSNIQRQTATFALGVSQLERTKAVESENKAVISLQTATAAQGAAEVEKIRAEGALLDASKSRSRQSAANAQRSRSDNPMEANLFSLQAFLEADTLEARAALLDNLLVNQQAQLVEQPELVNPWRSAVYALAMSPDGRYLAYGTNNGRVILSDYQAQTTEFDNPSGSQVHTLAFDRDGKTLASLNSARELIIWDVPSGEQLSSLDLRGKSDYKNAALAFDPRGERLAAGLGSGEMAIIDLSDRRNPEVLPPPSAAHLFGVNDVEWSPDGSKLASASLDGSVDIWDTTGWRVKNVITLDNCPDKLIVEPGKHPELRAVAWSPDGKLLAYGGHCGVVALAEIDSEGNEHNVRLINLPKGVFRRVNSLDFSPDGQYVAAGLEYTDVSIWDVKSGRRITDQQNFRGNVKDVRFSPFTDQLLFATGDKSGEVRLFRLMPEQKLVKTIAEKLGGPVIALENMLADQGVIAAVDDPARGVVDRYLNPDGNLLDTPSQFLLESTRGGSVVVPPEWAPVIVRQLSLLCLDQSEDCITPNLAQDQRDAEKSRPFFFEFYRSLSQAVHNIGRVKILIPMVSQPDQRIQVLASNPLNENLSVTVDGSLLEFGSDLPQPLWLLENSSVFKAVSKRMYEEALSLEEWHNQPSRSPVKAAAYSPGGDILAAANQVGEIKIWHRRESGWSVDKNLYTPHQAAVSGLAFSPDGSILAIAYADRLLQLWDVETGRAISNPLGGAPNVIRSLAFDETGKILYTGDDVGTILAWNLDPVHLAEQVCNYSKTAEQWGVFFPGEDRPMDCSAWLQQKRLPLPTPTP